MVFYLLYFTGFTNLVPTNSVVNKPFVFVFADQYLLFVTAFYWSKCVF